MEQVAVVQEQKPEKQKKVRKKKSKAKWIVLGLLVVIVVVVLVMCNSLQNTIMNNLLAKDDTTVIVSTDLTYSISATGTVVSDNSRNVNSTQAYQVKEVFVEVGERVNAGDPLCKLDSETLENSIAKMELSIELSQKTGKQQVKAARDSYNAAKNALEQGLNSSLVSAQSQVNSAYNAWQNAKKTYEDYQEGLDRGMNSTIKQQQTAKDNADDGVESANKSVTAAQRMQSAAQDAYDLTVAAFISDYETNNGGSSPTAAVIAEDPTVKLRAKELSEAASAVSSAHRSLSSAQSSYNTAKDNLKVTEYNSDITLENYKIAMDNAYQTYETAIESMNAAELSVDTQLQASKNSLASSQLGANTDLSSHDLQQLYKDLDKTTITAPVAGTVTAVYAKVGNAGSGLLFVIEDTDNLIVETSVKEFDISTVTEGLPVVIKSDATGDTAIDGKIKSISPTSTKTAAGTIDTMGDIVFPTDVDVLTKGSGLRIGMSVRLNYIVEEKSSVLAVPYEAVYTNATGDECILTLTEQPDGNYLVNELSVTTGMETDLYIEVSGNGVHEGLRVINTAENFTAYIGQALPLAEHRLASGTPFAGMMRG
ncbi:HlyD family efflux transporter periplasmic adaptor subunit [Christensenellaceae bacterium OttesenSCG-928-M15]|nr:HlyD family efflux transporter periplasmic adaptor subunit [Christensenellaceae bacterium OttesenSCG-928-M15]